MSSRELNILIKAKNLTGNALKGVKSELKGLDKTLGKGVSSAWKNTEKAIVIGAGAAAGAIGYAATKAIGWEDAFAGVKKTINESDLKSVGLDFQKLGDQFRDLARNMPVTAEDLAHIGEAAGALGIQAKDILSFTEVVAKLGVTTDLTDESASDALGHLANVLHLSGNDFAELADSLVALGNNGASTESQIIEIAQRFGAAGHSAGLAKEDILALASTTASMGIEVEAGGSALSRVFNGIATNIGTGSAKAKAFAKVLGLSAKQFKTAWQRDALGTFEDFLEELNKMDQFDAAATLKSIGITNTRDVNAIRLLSSGYKELNKQLEVSRHAAGAMDKEAQQRFATTKSQLQILKNNLDDAAITIGSALLPKINELAKKATDWLKGHQPQIKQFANDLAKGFESAVTWASKLDWNAIGNTLKTVGGVGKTLLDTFLHMPSWVQVAVATGWGLNKFTGGAVGSIVGELGKGLIKGVMNMNAGVVNVKGAVVNAPGGGVDVTGGATGGKGRGFLDGVLTVLKIAIPIAVAAAAVNEVTSGRDKYSGQNTSLSDLGLTPDEITAAKVSVGSPSFRQGVARGGHMVTQAQIDSAMAKLKANGFTLHQLSDGSFELVPIVSKVGDPLTGTALSARTAGMAAQSAAEHATTSTAQTLANLGFTPNMGPKGRKPLLEQGKRTGTDPFGEQALAVFRQAANPKEPKVMGEIKRHIIELRDIEKTYLKAGNTEAASHAQQTIEAMEKLIGVTSDDDAKAKAAIEQLKQQQNQHASSNAAKTAAMLTASRDSAAKLAKIPPHLSRIEGAGAETARYTGITSRKNFSPHFSANVYATINTQVRMSVNSVARSLTSLHVATGQAGGPGGVLQ